MEIERASVTAEVSPTALLVFELDGSSMLETPPLLLTRRTETEAPAGEDLNVNGSQPIDEVVEPAGEDDISVEPLASGSTALGAKLVRTGKRYLGVPLSLGWY